MSSYNIDARGSNFGEHNTMTNNWGGVVDVRSSLAPHAARLEAALHEAGLANDPSVAAVLARLRDELEDPQPRKSRIMAFVERITATAGGVTAVANATQAFRSALDNRLYATNRGRPLSRAAR